ncbi:MAG: alpha-D-ribose 1-methylphosphonate 5-triphosphate diphosphatase [Pseudomonadota bacterium]
MDWVIEGGEALGEAGLERRDVFVSGGALAERAAPGARRFDARGLVVAPGIVDLHGDGFERNFSPRAGVFFDPETALIETDRQLIANGITTAYLAMTISYEPGLRSVENARAWVAALERVRPRLIADIRWQLRWELYALDAVEEVAGWLSLAPRPVLAFNDHFSMLFDAEGREKPKLSSYLARSGLSEAEYRAMIAKLKARADEVPAAVERLAVAAAAVGAPCFAHDEMSVETRRAHRGLGIGVSEFPMTEAVAREAVAAGEPTVLGAPNVVRGGSHIGALDAEPAARAGLCTALASDYWYPAPLAAAARMLDAGDLPAEAAWSLVSAGPARAAGLTDRGTLAPGGRADLALFRREGRRAEVEAAFVRGAPALTADFSRIAG